VFVLFNTGNKPNAAIAQEAIKATVDKGFAHQRVNRLRVNNWQHRRERGNKLAMEAGILELVKKRLPRLLKVGWHSLFWHLKEI
jgi:hypothetical protein